MPNNEHTLPPNNPYLIQDSLYPMAHFNSAQTDVTQLSAWQGDRAVQHLVIRRNNQTFNMKARSCNGDGE